MTELTDGVVTLRPVDDDGGFSVTHEGTTVGEVAVRRLGTTRGELSWSLHDEHVGRGYASRAVRLLVDHALQDLGLTRVQALVEQDNTRAVRVATRAGLMREGVQRIDGAPGMVVLARLRSDPPVSEPAGFRALLNSFLPRKRAIAQLLVRDDRGRVLLCRLTYKKDWDLPGGVVEVGESPQRAASREVKEELDLDLGSGSLLLTDWLPPWSGWDDAVCLVFDGGVHDPGVLDHTSLQPREIRSVQFCDLDEVWANCADYTARRVEAALRTLEGTGTPYTESGRA